jgi:glycosyltransferase involved in cell wall biosynthesis
MVYDHSVLIVPECHTPDTIKFHSKYIKEQLTNSDVLFCISNATALTTVELFDINQDKIAVIPLGSNVNLTQVEYVRNYIANVSKFGVEPYILILGTIEPRKNIALVLQWLSLNQAVTSSYRFVFVGRYGWGPTFEEMINTFKLHHLVNLDRISWQGYVDEISKASLLAGASALIYPSFFEGFGLPILEAMSAGVIVLSSSTTSMPEVLGDCGYYFNPESVESLNSAFELFSKEKMLGLDADLISRGLIRTAEFTYDKAYEIIIAGLENGLKSLRIPT